MKKIKFKEKKTWLLIFSFIYLIIASYYLGELIYWDNNISIDNINNYVNHDKIFLIKIMIIMLMFSFWFLIGWIFLKIRERRNKIIQNNISPQS